MTTLAITPNWKNKGAKFKGTVAAGEHVSVTIQNDNGEGGEFIEDVSALRLRVVDPCNGRTLAIFPEPVPEGETSETWDADLSPLRCTLNLNTVQMLKAVPPAANVPLLWVLDDYENKTLYFKEQFPVEHWPRLRGEEEPTDLDDYKDIIADFNTRLTAAEQTVATAAANAQSAAASASAAAASASTAATAATDAQTGAIASKNAAQTAANDAASAKTAAEDAQDAAKDAQEAAETAQGKAREYAEAAAESAAAFAVDDTLSVEGAAADAKAVGEANQDLITRIETVQDNLDAEVTARGTLAAAVGDNRQNLAAEIARANGAEQTLEANKADKATTYTKTEVDTKIAGVQTFQKYLVNELPDPEVADYKGLYLVPTGETTPEGDLCYEYTVVGEVGSRRWEKIGGTTVDLSNYYDKNAVNNLMTGKQDKLTFDDTPTVGSNNPVKSGGIWSALWGTATTAFSSLYDWCVSQLAGKVSKTGDTMTGPLWSRGEEIRPKAWSNKGGPKSAPAHSVFGPNGICYEPAYENAYSGREHIAKFRSDKDGFFAFLEDIASDYSDETVYTVGQLAIVDGVLKKCTTAGTGGLAVFSATTLEDVLAALRTGKADVSAIPYTLANPIVINTASSEVVEGETVNYGEATLADRTQNQVFVLVALDELRVTIPPAVSGKVRDFGLIVGVGLGEGTALAAPALVPVAPTGETIAMMNSGGEMPTLADGTTTSVGFTVLYFTEIGNGTFLVKGEQIKGVA